MRDVLLLLIFLGVVPFILRRPAVGIYAWTVVSTMNPHRQAWGFAYNLPFGLLVAGLTLVSLLFSREPKNMKGGAASAVLFLLLCYMGFTTFFALLPDRAIPMLDRVVRIQLMTFVALFVLYKREHVQAVVWAVAGSIGFYAIKGGLYTIATGGTGRVWGPADSFIYDNNAMALATVISVPLWAYLYTQYRDKPWIRRSILAAIVLSCLSVLGSQSRGAFLAIGAMLAFLWLKSHKKLLLGIVLAIGAAGLVAFMPSSWEERMATIGNYQTEGSAISRIETWKMLGTLAADRPLIGGGFEPYSRSIFERYNPEYPGSHSAHSIYFQVLGEHGFLAFGLFLLFWLLMWRMCSQLVEESRGKPDREWAYWLGQMVKVSLVAYLVGGAFLNLAYWDVPYFIFVCVAVSRWILRREAVEELRTDAVSNSNPPELAKPPELAATSALDERMAGNRSPSRF